LYVALQASCVRALPDLASHELPLADAARVYGGATFYRLMVATTSVSALGIVIGMLAMTPRYLAPLGHDDALGFGLDELSTRAVPLRAFGVTYALLFVMLVASALWGSIGNLLALSSLSVTVQYAVTAMALFKLASQRQANLVPADRWPVPLALRRSTVARRAAKLPIALRASLPSRRGQWRSRRERCKTRRAKGTGQRSAGTRLACLCEASLKSAIAVTAYCTVTLRLESASKFPMDPTAHSPRASRRAVRTSLRMREAGPLAC